MRFGVALAGVVFICLIGATLTNFPGKYAVERWLVGHRTVVAHLQLDRNGVQAKRKATKSVNTVPEKM